MLNLNDKNLREFLEQLNLEINNDLPHQHYEEILKSKLNEYKHLFINQWVDSHRTIIFFQIMGPQGKQLSINDLTLLNMILFCANVEVLTFGNIRTTELSDTACDLFDKLPSLKELKLCHFNLTDSLMERISTIKNLKFLNITDSILTGKNLHLDGLEQLSLKRCKNIEERFFTIICQNHTNLNYLDIMDCKQLNTENFQHILQYLKQLKTLKMSNIVENFNSIAQLPNLKELEIDCLNAAISKEFFNDLVNYRAEQLKSLILWRMNEMDMFSTKFSLIAKLKKLKNLTLDGNFVYDNKQLVLLSNLKELEDIWLYGKSYGKLDDGILKILQNCLKLKNLVLCVVRHFDADFELKASTLVREQIESGQRTDPVILKYDMSHEIALGV